MIQKVSEYCKNISKIVTNRGFLDIVMFAIWFATDAIITFNTYAI